VTDIDVAIIGAGLTGLACAREIAARGKPVCVLERHPRPGLETSTHNSGVIHAGLYYPASTLKTRLCIEGRPLLYEFCAAHGVPHSRCGKLVVARAEEELSALEALAARARANGVERLEIVDRPFIARREPAVDALAAIYSPDTGIVDAETLVRRLMESAAERGAVFLPGTPLIDAAPTSGSITLTTASERIAARQVVNAAGLYADDVSRMLGARAFSIYPCRGEYAELAPRQRHLVNGLVYPLPHDPAHGLGVHLTRSVAGNVWIGPTAKYQNRKDDYESDRLPLEAFVEPVRRLLPEVTMADLRLSGAGIRPRLHPPNVSFADFMIERDRENANVVQAAGIESPGLTSCLAIARMVADIVDQV